MLKAWCETDGADIVREVVSAVPSVGLINQSFEAIPCSSQIVLQSRHPTRAVASIVQKLTSSSRACNLASCLDKQWLAMHKAILQHECTPIVEPKLTRPRIPECWKVGLCLCGPSGKAVASIRTNLYSHMKMFCKGSLADRALLVDRRLVVRLEGQAPGDVQASPWAVALQPDHGPTVVFWHVASHSFSPYESSFLPLALKGEDAFSAVTELRLEVHIINLCLLPCKLGVPAFHVWNMG